MNKIINGDAFEFIKSLDDNSIDACITDPPYFIDGLGDEWDKDAIDKKENTNGTIKGLPKGMKFDPQQGKRFQSFMHDVSKEVFRVLKPGGAFISFSQARLYHRMAVSVEDAGFEIRDMLGWTYEGQAKAFSLNHFIDKSKNYTDKEKQELKDNIDGWKTPQLKPMIEPMCFAQKPTEGKFLDNWIKYKTGLINTKELWEDKFPGNIMKCSKPTKKEKGDFNDHVSVKPLELTRHLIKLFTTEDAIVLDPFLGSGTTAVACKLENRKCYGTERETHYYNIINQRLESINTSPKEDNIFVYY
jgi:site-specific DNA-methyltransferase (adenine-specific)